jgi:hypothetical protein
LSSAKRPWFIVPAAPFSSFRRLMTSGNGVIPSTISTLFWMTSVPAGKSDGTELNTSRSVFGRRPVVVVGLGTVDAFANDGKSVGIISATMLWMSMFGIVGSSLDQPFATSRGLIDSTSCAPAARSVGITCSLKTRIVSASFTVMLGMNRARCRAACGQRLRLREARERRRRREAHLGRGDRILGS